MEIPGYDFFKGINVGVGSCSCGTRITKVNGLAGIDETISVFAQVYGWGVSPDGEAACPACWIRPEGGA